MDTKYGRRSCGRRNVEGDAQEELTPEGAVSVVGRCFGFKSSDVNQTTAELKRAVCSTTSAEIRFRPSEDSSGVRIITFTLIFKVQ